MAELMLDRQSRQPEIVVTENMQFFTRKINVTDEQKKAAEDITRKYELLRKWAHKAYEFHTNPPPFPEELESTTTTTESQTKRKRTGAKTQQKAAGSTE